MNKVKICFIMLKKILLGVIGMLFFSGCNSDFTSQKPPDIVYQTNTPQIEGVNTQSSPFTNTINTNNIMSSNNLPSNKILPNNILKEISYFAGGGIIDECPSPHPHLIFWQYPIEVYQPINIMVCGWAANEFVTTIITKPNGQQLSETSQASFSENTQTYNVYIGHTASLSEAGHYNIIIRGDKFTLNEEMDVLMPKGPRYVFTKGFFDGDLLLYNFYPNEQVSVIIYEKTSIYTNDAQFIAWDTYEVGSDGQLVIKNTNPDHVYVILGAVSGKASFAGNFDLTSNPIGTAENDSEPLTNSSGNFSCAGAPETRLQVNARAQVTFTDGSPNRIRDLPASANVLGTAPEGTGMTIIDGPVCDNERVWWKVETDNGYTGWTAEGAPGEYWLEPIN